MILTIVLLIAGVWLLLHGARMFVHGASSLALRLHVPPMAIGLTIVAFGTSAPELVVSLSAALRGVPDLGIGNILGANIINVFFILGVAAVIGTLHVKRLSLQRDIPLLLLGTATLAVLTNDRLFFGHGDNSLSRTDGLLLVALFLFFLYRLFEEKGRDGLRLIEHFRFRHGFHMTLVGPHHMWIAVAECIAAAGALWLGSVAFVHGLSRLGVLWGVPDQVLGLTIAAFGTTLPELFTTVTALAHRKTDIAIGNVLGSNIFNLLFILGATALIRPLSWSTDFEKDVAVNAIALCVLLAVTLLGRGKNVITRNEGAVLVAGYASYLVYLGMRYIM